MNRIETVRQQVDEILKDADVLQHAWYNPLFEVKQAEQERYEKLMIELGIEKEGF